MWIMTEEGRKLFRHGREDYNAAARAAQDCPVFGEDVEEEWVTDEARSCYNCRFRRWTAESFFCQRTSTYESPPATQAGMFGKSAGSIRAQSGY